MQQSLFSRRQLNALRQPIPPRYQLVRTGNDVHLWGKYKGKRYADIAVLNPSYLVYLACEGKVKFDKELIDLINKQNFLSR